MQTFFVKCSRWLIFLAVLGVLFVGCGGGGGGGGGGGTVPVVPTVAPNGLSYTVAVTVYTAGVPITPNLPTVGGGTPTLFEVNPALPAGLVLDPDSGIISGTPTVAAPARNYKITASNVSGATSVDLQISVILPPPNNLGYTTPIVYSVGIQIAANQPTTPLPGASTYQVDPPLPAGLSINANSGVLIGTPLADLAETEFTVTQITLNGSKISILVITIVTQAPANFAYDTPVTYFEDVTIDPNIPVISGSPAVFTVQPSLPVGLTLDAATGVISGTPTVLKAAADYVVKATNSAATASATVNIKVVSSTICALEYFSPVTYVPNSSISPNTPIVEAGCAFDTYSVTPALPDGLSLDPDTGEITGTPTTNQGKKAYSILASGVDGFSGSTTLSITIGDVYNYAMDSLSVNFNKQTGVGSFQVPVSLEEDANNPSFPHEIIGFQLGIAHDPNVLQFVDCVKGSDLVGSLGAAPAIFLVGEYPAGVTVGVVMAYDPFDPLIAIGPQEILVLTYDTNAAELAGAQATITTKLEFVDTLGPDPPDVVITNQVVAGDTEVVPVPYDATVELVPQ